MHTSWKNTHTKKKKYFEKYQIKGKNRKKGIDVKTVCFSPVKKGGLRYFEQKVSNAVIFQISVIGTFPALLGSTGIA